MPIRLHRSRTLLAIVLAVVALITWRLWPTSPAAAATTTTAPTSVGKLVVATTPGFSAPVLAFTNGGSAPISTGGSGAGAGKFAPTPANLVFASGAQAPILLRTIATGTHIPTATVTLYAPGSTRPAERWIFSDVLVTSLTETSGAIGKSVKVSLSLSYAKVTWATLDSTGKTVTSYCWDVATNAAC